MKLLLTSSGITNATIHKALVDLLGKPIAESSALVIPTAIYPFHSGFTAALLLRAPPFRQPRWFFLREIVRYIVGVNARVVVLLAAATACHSKAPTPPSSHFGYYLLAMTWSPATKDQCTLPPAFTLHGLWPNYSEAQAIGKPQAWPQYCGAFAHCEATEDASCAPGAPVPAELAGFAPAYVNGTLATHEWSKHGSCTTMSPSEFFAAELAAIHSIPHDGTPDVVRAAAGHDLSRDELEHAFGVSPDAVVLGCTASCELTQVAFCIARDDRERPTTTTSCTTSVTTSDYDNGCAVRRCERVRIPATCAHSI